MSTGWTVGLILGVVVILVAALIVIRIVLLAQRIAAQARTAVGPAEMLVEIRVPVVANSGSAYLKVDRRVGDWAVVAAGAALTLGEDGRITQAGLALAAVGGDITAREAEQALIGEPPTQPAFERAARIAQSACQPVSDQRGSADYKRHVVGVLTERVLARATGRAQPKKEE